MDATILIGTFGDDLWRARGQSCWERHEEFGFPVIWHHEPDGTIAQVRNRLVDIADENGAASGWLCFVDADDHLESGYFREMQYAADLDEPWQLVTPAVRYGPGSDPMVFRDRNMRSMNPCAIGTLIHRAVFEQAGRFWEERAWEDWSLFRRAWLLGAPIVFAEAAVYQAGSNRQGRNSTVHHPEQLRDEIIAAHDRWMREMGVFS